MELRNEIRFLGFRLDLIPDECHNASLKIFPLCNEESQQLDTSSD